MFKHRLDPGQTPELIDQIREEHLELCRNEIQRARLENERMLKHLELAEKIGTRCRANERE